MTSRAHAAARRLVLEIVGWVLVVLGLAALVLPGPGLLMIFAGLALLSSQYAWARRLVEPVRLRALRGAADGVETWPRIILSTLGALCIGGFGVLWIVHPPAPTWWPLRATYWLLGGDWTGVTLLVSCAIALAVLGYAFRRFRGHPDALHVLDDQIEHADEEVHH
ncbi:MAG: PGPGW domain-containing protein [Nocardioides sp.]|nr:PGPGW domain-containing protein [Nocardioides sp.]